MSRKRKKEAPLPASSAGLLRFFEDETQGVKIKPELIVGFSIALVIVAILLDIFL